MYINLLPSSPTSYTAICLLHLNPTSVHIYLIRNQPFYPHRERPAGVSVLNDAIEFHRMYIENHLITGQFVSKRAVK